MRAALVVSLVLVLVLVRRVVGGRGQRVPRARRAVARRTRGRRQERTHRPRGRCAARRSDRSVRDGQWHARPAARRLLRRSPARAHAVERLRRARRLASRRAASAAPDDAGAEHVGGGLRQRGRARPPSRQVDRLRSPRVLRDPARRRRHDARRARRAAVAGRAVAVDRGARRAVGRARRHAPRRDAAARRRDGDHAGRRRRARRHAGGARLPLQLSQRRRLRRLADLVLQRALPVRLRRQGRKGASRALRRGRLRRRARRGAPPPRLEAGVHERRRSSSTRCRT